MVIYSIAPKLKKKKNMFTLKVFGPSVIRWQPMHDVNASPQIPVYFWKLFHSSVCKKKRCGWVKFKHALFIFAEIIKQGGVLFYSMLFYTVTGNEESILGVTDVVH